jgi:hypothetical protein
MERAGFNELVVTLIDLVDRVAAAISAA